MRSPPYALPCVRALLYLVRFRCVTASPLMCGRAVQRLGPAPAAVRRELCWWSRTAAARVVEAVRLAHVARLWCSRYGQRKLVCLCPHSVAGAARLRHVCLCTFAALSDMSFPARTCVRAEAPELKIPGRSAGAAWPPRFATTSAPGRAQTVTHTTQWPERGEGGSSSGDRHVTSSVLVRRHHPMPPGCPPRRGLLVARLGRLLYFPTCRVCGHMNYRELHTVGFAPSVVLTFGRSSLL